jgi:hypothetical protein
MHTLPIRLGPSPALCAYVDEVLFPMRRFGPGAAALHAESSTKAVRNARREQRGYVDFKGQ